MAKVSRIGPITQAPAKRKKVAAYARVSKNTERLLHSVSAQVSYYSKLIQGNPEWEYAGVYADCGISGTGIRERDEFRHLLADCEAGKIDIVLTKSISRFARNTVDLLAAVRRLKELGVEVRFEKEHISSFTGDGELMLTILASFAQEESRSISENCKWGIRKRFRSGEIGTANKHLIGYRYDEEKKRYLVVPEEAEMIRRMFRMYLDGLSLRIIAGTMNEAGYRSVNGKLFQEASVRQLLQNDVYAGIIRRQKSYIADPITGKKVINDGVLPQYVIRDAHEAILDREAYEQVLAEHQRRKTMQNPTYPFTRKLRCGICGRLFSRKKCMVKGKTYVHWICRSKKEVGTTCCSVNFSEAELERISAQIMDLAEFDAAEFEKAVKQITVERDGSLMYDFYEGRTEMWQRA